MNTRTGTPNVWPAAPGFDGGGLPGRMPPCTPNTLPCPITVQGPQRIGRRTDRGMPAPLARPSDRSGHRSAIGARVEPPPYSPLHPPNRAMLPQAAIGGIGIKCMQPWWMIDRLPPSVSTPIGGTPAWVNAHTDNTSGMGAAPGMARTAVTPVPCDGPNQAPIPRVAPPHCVPTGHGPAFADRPHAGAWGIAPLAVPPLPPIHGCMPGMAAMVGGGMLHQYPMARPTMPGHPALR